MAYIDHVTKDSTRNEIVSKPLSDSVASEYSSSATYAVGDYCMHEGTLYRCSTAISTAEAWTSGHWTTEKITNITSDLKDALILQNDSTELPLPGGSIIQGSFDRSGNPESPARSDRIRVAGFIPVYKGQQFVFTPGTKATDLLIGVFNSAKVYQNNKPSSGWYSDITTIDIEENGYFVVCFRRTSSNVAISPSDYDAETKVIPVWNQGMGLTDEVKTALVNCFANVLWTNSYGKNYFENLAELFGVTIGLDAIAYGNLTYRDIFVTNNFIKIGDFEDVTLSSTEQTLSNGDKYKINYGDPEISTSVAKVGNKSLKVTTGSVSSQAVYKSTRLPASAKMLMAACIQVDEYISGNVGMQVNVSSAGLSAPGIGFVYANSVTDGFVEVVKLNTYEYDPTQYPDGYLNVFIGEFSSGKANAYVDACVVTVVPGEMTLEEAEELYHNYIGIVSN